MPSTSVGQLYVDINARLGELERGFATARKQASVAGSQIGLSLSGSLTGVLGAVAIGAGFTKAIKGAADLNETLSKVGQVFGPQANQVVNLADELASRFGLVKTPVLDAAASIGLIGRAAGQSQGAAAQMADRLTRLAADASSFFNVPLEDALQKIRSALVGESEPIRTFGVLLNENAVRAEALAQGLVKGKDQLTEQAKVMARASLIAQGLATVSGDLARTQSSASNQFRQFSGTVDNLSTTFGQTLLPVVTQALGLINEGLQKLSGSFEQSKTSIEGFGARFSTILETIGFTVRNFGDIWEVVSLRIQEGAANIAAYLLVLPENLGIIADYIRGNWRELIIDAINAVATAFRNLAANVFSFVTSLTKFFQDPTQGFEFNWTPLLDSFQATAEALPELLQPQLVSMQEQIDKVLARIGGREAARAAAAATPALAAPVPDVGPAAPPGKATKPVVQGVEEFARGLLASSFGKEGVAEKTLAAQEKQLTVMEQVAEFNRLMKENLDALVRRGTGATAVGPA